MDNSEWFVILNPAAGSADDRETLRKALERLGRYRLVTTEGPKDALTKTRKAIREGYRRIAAAGGDGTLNEVVNGMRDAFDSALLGLLPLGTGNDFARSAGIPDDLDGAVEVLGSGSDQKVDLVHLSVRQRDSYFINASAGGFATLVDEQLTEESKDFWGGLAYYIAAAKALPRLTEYQFRIRLDSEPVITVSGYNLVVCNGRTIAGGLPIAPEAAIDDGRMDIVVVPALPLPQLTLLVSRLLRGEHLESEDIFYRKAARAEVFSNPAFLLNTDGEAIGEVPALFQVLPGALRVAAPQRAIPVDEQHPA
jgi:diacylglycerol kinase (ATP)